MTELSAVLLDPANKDAVVADFAAAIDTEARSKKGVSGTVVKGAYLAVAKVGPKVIPNAVTKLLPDAAVALDPFWADYQLNPTGDFGAYLVGRDAEVSDALLAVTDRKAETATQEPLKKAYGAVRGKASGHVIGALPVVGSIVAKYATS